MSPRRRVLLLLFPLSVVACGGKVTESEPSDGGDDASTVRPDIGPTGPDTTPVARPETAPAGETGVTCCPMGPPSCDGPLLGGSPPCGRRAPSDVSSWDVEVDGNGCPYLVPGPGSCLGPLDHGRTTGLPCTDDATCDTTGDGVNACSNALFSLGTLYPSPVCVGKECDPGTHTAPRDCDGGTGVCLSTSSLSICLPRCTFDAAGAPPTGCVGKDVCNPYGWTVDATGMLHGIGYCFGGCRTSADCTKGDQCQVESGLCVRKLATYTTAPGTACDPKPPVTCNCIYDSTIGKGYCASACRVGVDSCAPGFTCDAQLPKPTFALPPMGVAGNCLKNCASDTDCAGLNAKCLESAGTGQKTCQTGLPF